MTHAKPARTPVPPDLPANRNIPDVSPRWSIQTFLQTGTFQMYPQDGPFPTSTSVKDLPVPPVSCQEPILLTSSESYVTRENEKRVISSAEGNREKGMEELAEHPYYDKVAALIELLHTIQVIYGIVVSGRFSNIILIHISRTVYGRKTLNCT